MARVVGLDIGAHRVRLVEVEAAGKGLRVVRLGERDLDAVPDGGDREDVVRTAVDALFRDTRSSRGEVVLSWGAEACILREINVPFRAEDQIRKVAKFEFESHLHSQAIEEVVVDFVRVAETREGSRLLAVAAPKAPLRARLAALDRVKIDPVAVDVDVAALVEAAATAGALAEHPSSVLLDVGSRSTKIALVLEGHLLTARALRGGVDGLAGAIEKDLGVDAGAASSRAVEGGPREDDLLSVPGVAVASDAPAGERSAASLEVAVVEDRRSDFLDRLCREVTRTVATAAPGVTFGALLVTGRGSLIPGVRERLAASVGLPVQPLDLFRGIPNPVPPDKAEEANAVYAVALGAAARALRLGPTNLDLRREDLAFARRFDQVKGSLAAALGLCIVAVGFLLWRAKTEKEASERDFAAMVSTAKATTDDVEKRYEGVVGKERAQNLARPSGAPLQAIPDAHRRAKQMHDTLRNELGLSTDVPPIVSSLEVFKRVHQAVTSVRERVEYCLVDEESYDQREVKITFILSDRDHADILKGALDGAKEGATKLFATVEYGGIQQRARDGKWPVTFTCTLPKTGAAK